VLEIVSTCGERGILPWESLRGNPVIPVGGILELHHYPHGTPATNKKAPPLIGAVLLISSIVRRERDSSMGIPAGEPVDTCWGYT